jgi:hypothetical protein
MLILLVGFTTTFAQSVSNYARFGGTITVVTDEAIKYDSEILVIYNIEPKLRPIFESGLLYPSLFKDDTAVTPSVTGEVKDSMTVSDFSIFQSESAKIKTFRFMVLQNNAGVAKQYWLQLVNNQVNWSTDILTFIEGVKIKSLKVL